MAFVSNKAVDGGDVKDYVNDLDERVKTEFGVVNSRFGMEKPVSGGITWNSLQVVDYIILNADIDFTSANGEKVVYLPKKLDPNYSISITNLWQSTSSVVSIVYDKSEQQFTIRSANSSTNTPITGGQRMTITVTGKVF